MLSFASKSMLRISSLKVYSSRFPQQGPWSEYCDPREFDGGGILTWLQGIQPNPAFIKRALLDEVRFVRNLAGMRVIDVRSVFYFVVGRTCNTLCLRCSGGLQNLSLVRIFVFRVGRKRLMNMDV